MKDKRIEVVKNWPEPKSMRDIQVLLCCASFYRRFHPGLKSVSRTTHLDAQNDYNQISRELVSVRDMAEDAEVDSGTSSTTRSAENSLSDMAEDAEVDDNGDGGDNETVERLPSKKSNVPMGYFTPLRSDADSALLAKR